SRSVIEVEDHVVVSIGGCAAIVEPSLVGEGGAQRRGRGGFDRAQRRHSEDRYDVFHLFVFFRWLQRRERCRAPPVCCVLRQYEAVEAHGMIWRIRVGELKLALAISGGSADNYPLHGRHQAISGLD